MKVVSEQKQTEARKPTELKLKSTLRDVPLAKMRVSENAQRELKQHRVDELASEFDPELLGYPVMSDRGGSFFTVDGQHRIEALKKWLGEGWEKQNVTCRVYTGLTESQEAELFDELNNTLTVNTYQKFKVRVTAGRPAELAVKKAVDHAGLSVSTFPGPTTVMCVGTLMRVFKRSDADILTRVLVIASQAYGEPGLRAPVIDGISRVIARYGIVINDGEVITRLAAMRGGTGPVLAKAHLLQKQTGMGIGECMAAALVGALNSQAKGGKKLPAWWKE